MCSANSEPLHITIKDPCFSSSILTDIFSKVMSAPRLAQDSLNIKAQIGAGWPWTTAVDYNSDPSYGSQLCGSLIYSITEADPNNSPDMKPTSLVTIEKGVDASDLT